MSQGCDCSGDNQLLSIFEVPSTGGNSSSPPRITKLVTRAWLGGLGVNIFLPVGKGHSALMRDASLCSEG